MAKVTKREIRNNMESFAAFVEGAEDHIARNEAGDELDVSPIAYGAQAMALYVQAVIDGEVALDNDMSNLAEIVVGVALSSYCEGAEDDDDVDEAVSAVAELDRAIASFLDAIASDRAGDGDDE